MLKKIISIFMVVCSLFSIFSITSFAKEPDVVSSDGTFEFVESSGLERIDENGDFWYEFSTKVTSDYFEPTRTSITISTITSTNTKAWFYITLYKDGEKVDSLLCKDDGVERSKTFTGLTVGESYMFYITKFNYLNGDLVEGVGHVTNIAV